MRQVCMWAWVLCVGCGVCLVCCQIVPFQCSFPGEVYKVTNALKKIYTDGKKDPKDDYLVVPVCDVLLLCRVVM
jgi:hypothetical protein